jgi:hypothetical protein
MQKGSWNFSVFDPTLNLTFSTGSSPYADYFQLVNLQRTDQTADIVINQGALPQRIFLTASPQPDSNQTLLGVHNGTYEYSQSDYGLNSFFSAWQPLLEQYGFTADLNGYLQFISSNVLSVHSTSSDSSARNAFLTQLQANGIPYSAS